MHLDILNGVERTHQRYVQAIHRFRDDTFDGAFRQMLRDEGNLARGPFLEALPSYQLEANTAEAFAAAVGANVDEKTLKAISKHPRLYWHQAESLRLASAGRNALIASGTGSGKTESFLYPILLHLYREALKGTLAKPGVRALVVYPMNALSNDQLDRLAELSESLREQGSKFYFTYGQYTGDTPEDEKDKFRDAQTKAKNRRAGELVFRDEMQRSPPHILLTNYSMLEYLLLRPDDSPLFDNGAAENWRFIIVDEAHQYNGTKGTEIGFLLRRLKQRLREGGRKDPFTCIATSATIVSTDGDLEPVAKFASDLFGEPFTPKDVLLGKVVGLPPLSEIPDPTTLTDPQLAASAELLRSDDFRRFLGLAMETPQEVAALARSLNTSEEAIEAWANKVADLVHPATRHPLTTVRYHLFLRTIPGLYTSYHPEKRVALNPRAENDAAWFYTVLCRRCGQHYLEGIIGKDHRLREPLENPVGEAEESSYFLPIDEPIQDTAYWRLNTLTGEMADPSDLDRAASWTHFIRLEKKELSEHNRSGNLTQCVICGYASREPIRSPKLETMEPQSLIALSLNRALPEDRNKVLAFSDGRQDAARFAVQAQDFADDAALRSILYRTLRDQHEKFSNTLHTLDDLSILVATKLKALKSADFQGLKGHQAAYRFLLREALNTTDAASFSNTGLMAAYLQLPEACQAPERWEKVLGFTKEEGREILSRLLDSTLPDNAVNLEKLDVDIQYWKLELASSQNSLVIGEVGNRKKVKSWDSAQARRGRIVEEILRENKIPFTDDTITKILLEAFAVLRKAQDENGDPLLLTAAEGDQVDARNLRFLYLAGPHRACPYCKTVRPTGPFVACTKTRCKGSFVETTTTPDEANPFLALYQQNVARRFRIEEHTAQLSKAIARLYQDGFRQGRIHALSSSTTFELGVDLGDLDTVFLRNIPPEPYNYTQRVGRVGRRKGFPGLVVVFARQRSHDFYHYANPSGMLRGRVRPPRISLTNERIFARHAIASIFSRFFRQYPATTETASALMEQGGSGIIDAVADFIDENETELRQHLQDAFQGIPNLEELIEEDAWINWTYGPESMLEKAHEEYVQELDDLDKIRKEAEAIRDYANAKWCEDRRITIQQERTINFLSRKSVIPKYGFPVDIVELDTQPTRKGGEDSPVSLQRDLSLAITEYAPGGEVVANKEAWRSVAVKRVKHREWPRKWFQSCKIHGTYTESMTKPMGKVCCDKMLTGQYIIPEYGFLTRPNSGRRPTGVSRYTSLSQPFFLQQESGLPWKEIANGDIRIRTASPGDMVILASADGRNPYRLCSECGLDLPKPKKGQSVSKHAPPTLFSTSENAGKCSGEVVEAHFGHKFRTTVLQVAFPRLDLPKTTKDIAVLFEGIGTAVTESAAEILQVPANEIGYTLTGLADGGSSLVLVLFDKAPGGAGLVEQLEDERLLFETMENATARVDGKCGCASDGSCYSCLRTSRNQNYHPFLKRGAVHDSLQQLLANFAGTPVGSGAVKFG